jgi:hypothetical protein
MISNILSVVWFVLLLCIWAYGLVIRNPAAIVFGITVAVIVSAFITICAARVIDKAWKKHYYDR